MKYTSKLIVTAAACSSLMMPVLAQASTPSSPTPQANFCSNYSKIKGDLDKEVATRTSNVANAQAASTAKLAKQRSAIDAKTAADRGKSDSRRAQHFAKLEARATTDAQKQAVAAFEATVKSALATRQAAIEQARLSFRQGEDAAIDSRRSKIASYRSSFAAAVAAAEAQAQSSCSAGTPAPQVRASFNAAVKTARTSYQSSVASLPKIGSATKSLASNRRAAVLAADKAYASTVHQAAATLAAALHK